MANHTSTSNNKPKQKSIVAYPKFGNSALSSEFYNYAFNIEFVAAVACYEKNEILIRKLKPFLN